MDQPSGIPCWTVPFPRGKKKLPNSRRGERGRTEGFDPTPDHSGSQSLPPLLFMKGMMSQCSTAACKNSTGMHGQIWSQWGHLTPDTRQMASQGSLAHRAAALAMINVSWFRGVSWCHLASQADVKPQSSLQLHRFGRFSRQPAATRFLQ